MIFSILRVLATSELFQIIIKLFSMSYFPESARKTNLEKIGTPSPGTHTII